MTPAKLDEIEALPERCCKCDNETGKAGRGDDSLYTDAGDGPFCHECYLESRLAEVEAQLKAWQENAERLETFACHLPGCDALMHLPSGDRSITACTCGYRDALAAHRKLKGEG